MALTDFPARERYCSWYDVEKGEDGAQHPKETAVVTEK